MEKKDNKGLYYLALVLCTISIFLMVFIIFSLITPIRNTEPEPIVKVEFEGQCGNPIQDTTRMSCAQVISINEQDNIIELVDEEGETWIVEVGNAKEFDANWYYCIFFDTMGTTDIYDDEVVKLWREVW